MTLADLVNAAIARREALLSALHAEGTTCYRVLHGATEGAPGLAVDRYGPVLLVQTWRDPLGDAELDGIAAAAERALGPGLVPVWNHRPRGGAIPYERFAPCPIDAAEGRELGLAYDVRPRHRGRDPLLFLDLRVGRRRVRDASAGRRVLNLFAYTCGVGVAALAGGATRVLNVDFADSALRVGRDNAARNGLSEGFETLREDVLPSIRQLAGLPPGGRRGRRPRFTRLDPEAYDLVVLDPPRWATSAFGAVDLVRDYATLFKPAVLATAPGGHLLATNQVASVDRDDWLDGLRRTAAKAGRPLGDVEVLAPEADFPSPDGRPPLKIAWIEVP